MTTTSDLRLVILSGGDSSEATVSRTSAQAVADALAGHYPNLVNLELNHSIVEEQKKQIMLKHCRTI